MIIKDIAKNIKKIYKWILNSDSILSWIVALILIFIIIKFILFPFLSLITGTSLPLAGVESSSMDHQIVKDNYGNYNLCGNFYIPNQKEFINYDKYWEICGTWYERKNISKEIFSEFPIKNGFKKGDIIIVWGRFKPKIGDIVIFKPNIESTSAHPIIHRIIEITNNTIQTKGDHNSKQLIISNNPYKTDETMIKEDQLLGKAILKIPYLGWVKLFFVELINKFR